MQLAALWQISVHSKMFINFVIVLLWGQTELSMRDLDVRNIDFEGFLDNLWCFTIVPCLDSIYHGSYLFQFAV